jgi:hypothetical protein
MTGTRSPPGGRAGGECDKPRAEALVVHRKPQPVFDATGASGRRGLGLHEKEARYPESFEVVDPIGLFGPMQDHDVFGGGCGDDISSGVRKHALVDTRTITRVEHFSTRS